MGSLRGTFAKVFGGSQQQMTMFSILNSLSDQASSHPQKAKLHHL